MPSTPNDPSSLPITDEPRVTGGTMRTVKGLPLPLELTAVEVHVGGPLAEVEVKQRFRNSTNEEIEAIYLFPLSHDAAVHKLRFQIGSRIVEGVVKEKEAARREYEAARTAGQTATLLEQERPNLFTMSVANIQPGERIEVTLGYQEKLAFDDGEYRFVYPMVAAERYHAGAPTTGVKAGEHAPATSEISDGGKLRARQLASGEKPPEITVQVTLRAGREIEAPRCLSHHVEATRFGIGSWRLHLAEPGAVPNRDFVLAFRAADKEVRPLVFFDRRGEQPGTFLLAVTPPSESTPELVLPRDLVILLDRSSSMRGGSLPQARRAVRYLLDGLAEKDRAALIAFDHERRSDDGVVEGTSNASPDMGNQTGQQSMPERARDPRLRAVTSTLREHIDTFLAGIEARGGTELETALAMAAAALPHSSEDAPRSTMIVLLTDAAVGNEGRLLRRVTEIVGPHRLYVLGIGPAVNRYLVERLARAGGGASDVILPGEDIDAGLARFRRRVQEGGPVVTHLRVSWDEALVADVYPEPVPDLFGGQPAEVVGRFVGVGKSKLVLTGRTATGGPFRLEHEVDLPREESENPGLERLWARRRIDSRLERLRLHPEEASEVRLEVIGLALKYSLMSAYTSFVAVDSRERDGRKDHQPRRVEVAQPLPAGHEREGAPADRLDDMRLAGGAAASVTRTGAVSWGEHEVTAAGMPAPRMPAAPVPGAARGYGPGSPAPQSKAMSPPPSMPGPPAVMMSAAPPMMSPSPFDAEERTMSGLGPPPMKRGGGLGGALSRAAGAVAGAVGSLFAGGGGKARDEGSAAADSDGGAIGESPSPEASEFTHESTMSGLGPAPQPPPQKPTKKSQAAGDAYSPELLAWARGKAIGQLDLVFLVDETGSMGSYIAEVQKNILHIITAIQGSPLCQDLRIGLVGYRDHPPQDGTFAARVLPLQSDIEAIKQGVLRLAASGGGDGPESVTDGLFELVRLDWRPRAVRTVVWIGDAPPHGVVPAGDGFPSGCPCGNHWYTQAECCREMGIVVHAVGCMPGLGYFVGAEDVFRTVARTTRGLFVPLREVKLLIPLITGVAESELDKQRIEEQVAELLGTRAAELGALEADERAGRITEILRTQNVRPRSLVDGEKLGDEAPALRFRELAPADVESALEQLRRQGRTEL